MFKREPNPTFAATVQITVPGGTSLPLDLFFKHMSYTKFKEFVATAFGKTDAEMLSLMVASVDEKAKKDGETDADFLADITEQYPAARADIFNTFKRELFESRVKN